MQREPDFVPAYANLADLYRSLGRDADAADVLTRGLAAAPADPSLLHALGLTLVREHRLEDALPLFSRAATARPEDAFRLRLRCRAPEAGRGPEACASGGGGTALPYDRDLLSALATLPATREPAAARLCRATGRRVAGRSGPAALLDSLREK
jgi:tetratricopeptide (TPR) repeat protein